MLLKIIVFICFFPLPVIIYFVLRNEAKPKKNIMLGVTLPLYARDDAAVRSIIKQHLTNQTIAFIALSLLAVPALFIDSVAVVMTWYLVWFIPVMVLPFLVFGHSNRKLKVLKQQNSWFGASSGITLVDVKLALTPKKTLSVWLFAPPVIMSLFPVISTILTLRGSDEFWPLMIVYASFAVLSVSLYFVYRIIFHQKAEVVDERTSLNAALTQVRRYHWGKCWLITVWLTGFLSLVMWLFSGNSMVILITTLIYTVVLLVFIMRAEFKTRKIQQKLTEESGQTVYTDDDEYWLFGLFYNNPNDRHFFINNRTGFGMTVNLSSLGGKILIGISLLVILTMPLLGFYMIREEFTPVTLEVTGTQLIAGHTSDTYQIFLDDIQSVYMLEQLPDGTRLMGTGMDTVLKGRFKFDTIGTCSVCLDPRTPPFIIVSDEDGTYILGASDNAYTLEVFEILDKQLASADVS